MHLFHNVPAPHGRRRGGFTLVELLVVIAIIAVLASLLMPALEEARNRANDIACLNNIRQLTVGVLLYVDDYNGAVPPHWGSGISNPNTYQSTKAPDNRWIILADYGHMRAALAWPDYITSGALWYCPSCRYTNYERYHTTPGGIGMGLSYYPNTAWSGQYYSSYAFPAVEIPITSTNYGGQWTGDTQNYWATTNYWNSYTYWGGSMIKPRAEQNASASRPMLWDYIREGFINHDLRNANVSYWDGSALVYPHARYLYETKVHSSYGARGMVHPSITSWLASYKRTEYVP